MRKPLCLPQNASAGLLPEYVAPELEICLRQHLTTSFLQSGVLSDFYGFIHGTHKSICLALPPALRRAAAGEGIKIKPLVSRWMWLRLQVKYMLGGMRFAVGLVLSNLRGRLAVPVGGKPYVVFMTISKRALPEKIDPSTDGWDMINWYRRSKLYDGELSEIWFNLTGDEPDFNYDPLIKIVQSPLVALPTGRSFISFVFEAIYLCLIAFASLLIGRWWAPIVLLDSIGVAYVKRIPDSQRAKDYFFHSSVLSIRPLWTYAVEKTGSRVTCIMYSHHFPIINPAGPDIPNINPVLAHLSWGRYAIWDGDQRDDILKLGGRDGEFVEVGPISVVDDVKTSRPELPANSVAIFDVNPIRPSMEVFHGLVRPYFSVENMLAFLDQSCRAIKAGGGIPVLKTKGDFDATYFQASRFIELADKHGCVVLEPGISPFWLVKNASAVITCPFTSIPSIGDLFGTPSCYFDPTGQLVGFERNAHGNDLVIGMEALRQWVTKSLNGETENAVYKTDDHPNCLHEEIAGKGAA